jgi:hypothetical protein
MLNVLTFLTEIVFTILTFLAKLVLIVWIFPTDIIVLTVLMSLVAAAGKQCQSQKPLQKSTSRRRASIASQMTFYHSSNKVLTELVLTALIFLTERVHDVLMFLTTGLVLTALMFLTGIVLHELAFLTEIRFCCTDIPY